MLWLESICYRCSSLGRRSVLRRGRRFVRFRSGLTLIEMLVSVAITLILVLAVVQVFAVVGANVRTARAVMEVSNDLRSVARQIQRDLDTHSAPGRPWVDPEAAIGYMELVEGPLHDRDFIVARNGTPLVVLDPAGNEVLVNAAPAYELFRRGMAARPSETRIDDYDSSFGDLDDTISLTVHSDSKPFVGRGFGGEAVESFDAEIVYWTAFLDVNKNSYFDKNETLYLMRREFLIVPNLVGTPPGIIAATNIGDIHDISVGATGRPNSLADLTNPVHRPLHAYPASFLRVLRPSDLDLEPDDSTEPPRSLSRFILMSDVRGFDMRVYDPLAPIIERRNTVPNVALVPGDPGYPQLPAELKNLATNPWVGRGAYVDIGYAVSLRADGFPDANYSDSAKIGAWFDPSDVATQQGRISYFSGVPSFFDADYDRLWDSAEPFWNVNGLLYDYSAATALQKQLFVQSLFRYDTWSAGFERDGLARTAAPPVPAPDQGINGIDDDNRNGVDDPGERDTAPPYDVALRGVEVRLRAMHYEMRQVRQVSIVSDMMPE